MSQRYEPLTFQSVQACAVLRTRTREVIVHTYSAINYQINLKGMHNRPYRVDIGLKFPMDSNTRGVGSDLGSVSIDGQQRKPLIYFSSLRLLRSLHVGEVDIC